MHDDLGGGDQDEVGDKRSDGSRGNVSGVHGLVPWILRCSIILRYTGRVSV